LSSQPVLAATSSAASLSADLMGLTLDPTPAAAKASADQAVATVPLPSMRYVTYPLLNHITGKGLQAEYTFGRYAAGHRCGVDRSNVRAADRVGEARLPRASRHAGARRCTRSAWCRYKSR